MIEITPIKKLDAEISMPGSKYIANRLLIICALADGTSVLSNAPNNDDINNAIAALRNFGVEIKKIKNSLIIKGTKGKLKQTKKEIDVGDSGTLLRFIIGIAALAEGQTKIFGSKRICERPIQNLLDSLHDLGIKIESLNDGCAPLIIHGGTFKGGTAKISGNVSSQFISSLLLIAPFAQKDVEIIVEGNLVSRGYVDLTIDLMKKAGIDIKRKGYKQFKIKSRQIYKQVKIDIPADWASANYFLAAAAIMPGIIRIRNINMQSNQPESQFVNVLKKIGCSIKVKNKSLTVKGPKILSAVEADMSTMPDSVQTLCAVALFSRGTTKITGISNLKYKESDRINDTAKELRKLGADIVINKDSLAIRNNKVNPAVIDPHNDHRMAMSLALVGLKIRGIKINQPECVSKSFPGFWNKMKEVGIKIKNV